MEALYIGPLPIQVLNRNSFPVFGAHRFDAVTQFLIFVLCPSSASFGIIRRRKEGCYIVIIYNALLFASSRRLTCREGDLMLKNCMQSAKPGKLVQLRLLKSEKKKRKVNIIIMVMITTTTTTKQNRTKPKEQRVLKRSSKSCKPLYREQ